jgi:hypothetical protein
MPKFGSIALLVVGVILLVYGLNASNSASSSLSQAVNGAPSNKAIWLIALGVLGIVSGGIGVLRRSS